MIDMPKEYRVALPAWIDDELADAPAVVPALLVVTLPVELLYVPAAAVPNYRAALATRARAAE